MNSYSDVRTPRAGDRIQYLRDGRIATVTRTDGNLLFGRYDDQGEPELLCIWRFRDGYNRCFRLVACVLFAVWLGGCGFPAWRDQALRDVAEGRWQVNPEQVQGSGQPSQTIEYYDAAGRHLGYGVSSGSTINLYGPDGSRLGSGRR